MFATKDELEIINVFVFTRVRLRIFYSPNPCILLQQRQEKVCSQECGFKYMEWKSVPNLNVWQTTWHLEIKVL